MPLPNIFTAPVRDSVVQRINQLKPNSSPLWGKMTAAQMLAHCNVTYEMIYEQKHPAPGPFMRWILKSFIKRKVVSEAAYAHNSRTAPQFIVADAKDFEKEKRRLIQYIDRTLALGVQHFDGKQSHSFGPLNTTEWNNMLYKHLDHHLRQFGV